MQHSLPLGLRETLIIIISSSSSSSSSCISSFISSLLVVLLLLVVVVVIVGTILDEHKTHSGCYTCANMPPTAYFAADQVRQTFG